LISSCVLIILQYGIARWFVHKKSDSIKEKHDAK
jgi:hypothetical protein